VSYEWWRVWHQYDLPRSACWHRKVPAVGASEHAQGMVRWRTSRIRTRWTWLTIPSHHRQHWRELCSPVAHDRVVTWRDREHISSTVVGALSKGRSSSPALYAERVVVAALSLAGGYPPPPIRQMPRRCARRTAQSGRHLLMAGLAPSTRERYRPAATGNERASQVESFGSDSRLRKTCAFCTACWQARKEGGRESMTAFKFSSIRKTCKALQLRAFVWAW
jgi:hypothetical protein